MWLKGILGSNIEMDMFQIKCKNSSNVFYVTEQAHFHLRGCKHQLSYQNTSLILNVTNYIQHLAPSCSNVTLTVKSNSIQFDVNKIQ